MTDKNKKLSIAFFIGCLLILCIAGGVVIGTRGGFGNGKKMADGISISGLDVSGMTKADAQKELDGYMQYLMNRTVKIAIDDQTVTAQAADLGYRCEDKNVIEKAFEVGKKGNVFQRMKEIQDIGKDKKDFALTLKVEEKVLRKYLEENCVKYDINKKDAKLKLVNGKFKATNSRNGRKLQIEDTIAVIKHALLKDTKKQELQVTAVVKITKAQYTKKQVEKCKDLLGSFSTDFSTSTAARANNVRTAANYINGTVLYPGETFSVVKVIKDRTVANGYQAAAEYSSGNVVEGIGGGVCQVSTTLYNAVLKAELEIVERSPHSMVVHYVPASRDAAIAGDYKDMKFKNNTKVPVYIAASAQGGILSFRIYGEETRANNRKIEYKSQIMETIQPGAAVETVDKTKAASYRVVTQSAHVGYKAKLWKIVTVDGKRTDKILINSSSYAAEPEHITVGSSTSSSPAPSAAAKASASPSASAKTKAKATAKPKAAASKRPVVTKKPTATKKPAATKSATTAKNTQ